MNTGLLTWQIWAIIAAILLISEMLTGTFVLLFLGIACASAGIVAAFNFNFALQCLTFCLISSLTIFLFLKQKKLNKKENSQNQVSNSERLIGKIGIVTEAIQEFGQGQVTVDNETWTAVSENQEAIKQDEKVRIKKISGVKLVVVKETL